MPIDAWDTWLVESLPAPGSSWVIDALMIGASTLGLLVAIVGVPWWLARSAPALARRVVHGMLGGLALTVVLQLLSLRPRPAVAEPLLPLPPLPSFPSGHAVLVAIAVVMLAAHRPRSLLASIPAALLVGLSRVHLGHHHASDVVGGMLVGIGVGLGMTSLARARADDPWRLRWVLWPQLGMVLAVSLVAYTGTFARAQVWWLRIPNMDKALHFLMFGLLALGVHLHTRGRCVGLGREPAWARVPLAVALPLSGASVEELMQALSPHRTADLGDLLADLLGLLTFWQLGRWLTARSGPGPATHGPATLPAWTTSSASAPPSRTPGPSTSDARSDSPPPPSRC